MKLPLSWLFDYLEHPVDDVVLEKTLGSLGLVVDKAHRTAHMLRPFTIVEILDVQPHPEADRLNLCTVTDTRETHRVVCGASNVHKGMKAVLGLSGTYVPGLDITLKPTTIRGVESLGMLCAAKELGLPQSDDDTKQIMDLPKDAPVGASFADYYTNHETIFDVDVTPNRGDCLSMRGIAREVQGAGLSPMKILTIPTIQTHEPSSIQVNHAQDPKTLKACPFFAGRMIRGLTPKASPDWLQNRLRSVGLKPISAVVDVTNYVLYALGRPLHAFDANKITGNLQVRFAKKAEVLVTLDGITRRLDESMLVIADDRGPQALAGIMGGMTTACDDKTTDIFLESAYFSPDTIAQTGQALGLLSDARHRFERGTDPALVEKALDLASQMIMDICGGQASPMVRAGSLPETSLMIPMPFDAMKKYSGWDVSPQECHEILERLGFMCTVKDTCLHVYVPTWRHDVAGVHDLIEDVLRVKGYEGIPSIPLPSLTPDQLYHSANHVIQRRENSAKARRLLASRGLHELYTWSFMKEEDAACFVPVNPSLVLCNPISADLSTMRPTHLGSLAKAFQRNKDRGFIPRGFFEVGLTYHDITLDGQRWVVSALRPQAYQRRHWRKPLETSVYDIKADAMALLDVLGFKTEQCTLDSTDVPTYYHPGQSSALIVAGKTAGHFGALHPTTLQKLDVEGPLYGFELDLHALSLVDRPDQRKPLYDPSMLQPLERDLAFIVDESVPAQKLIDIVRSMDRTLITHADVFDVYQGKGIPDGKKSVALWYRMAPQGKTLTDKEIHDIMNKMIHAIEEKTQGSLRQ